MGTLLKYVEALHTVRVYVRMQTLTSDVRPTQQISEKNFPLCRIISHKKTK